MLRIYLEDLMRKRQKRVSIASMAVLITGIGIMLFGTAKNNMVFMNSGLGIAMSALAALVVCALYISSVFSRCKGNVLEVNDGKVVACYTRPFVYKQKDLGDTQLVSIVLKPISATRTLRVPVYGIMLSCTVGCIAIVDKCQEYYGAFLSPTAKEKEGNAPEVVMGTHIADFLNENRSGITELFHRESNLFHPPEEYVNVAIKQKAEEFLLGELRASGLIPCRVTVACIGSPFTIE